MASPSLGHYASLSSVVIGRSLQIASESWELNGFNDFNGFNAFNELTSVHPETRFSVVILRSNATKNLIAIGPPGDSSLRSE